MKTILLVCSAGMSTSLLVTKMEGVDITQRFFENAQQSNIYTVHQI